ncbi:MAG TPA: dihydrodipicolinate synthase family protein, partial [Verrucomicrobiae bacterium]|nr:dihydrodipicolinate synthase family protein [Verrucomicrobiae bacterium]
PTIVAIKEASGNLDQVDQIRELCGITILSGDDGLTVPMMAIGARGVISVTANVAPDKMRQMVHAALKGDYAQAGKIHSQLCGLNKAMFIETNPIPVKTALALMKMIHGEFRMPLCEMGEDNKLKLKQALKKAGVLK